MAEQKSEKIVDKDRFDERLRFWTEQSLNQFGTTSNFFFLISLGFLAFLFDKKQIGTVISIEGSTFNFKQFFFKLSVLFAIISLIGSSITVLSRLYDLRLTRHIIWTRKRYYDKFRKLLPDDFIDLNAYSRINQITNFCSTFKSKSFIISDEDLENSESFNNQFKKIRIRNLLLARFSWWAMSFQILTLLISLVFFAMSLMI